MANGGSLTCIRPRVFPPPRSSTKYNTKMQKYFFCILVYGGSVTLTCIRPRGFPPAGSSFVRGVNPDSRAGPEPACKEDAGIQDHMRIW